MQETLLIRSILAGHTADYTQLVKKYEAAVFRIVMGFVHQKEDAEDITQEVFIKAYQSLADFAGQSSFSTWLYRIAIHTSLNALQKEAPEYMGPGNRPAATAICCQKPGTTFTG